MKRYGIAALSALWLTSGCTSLSGLGGENEFGCKAPPGVTCQSISGVHANAMAQNLPFQRQSTESATPEDGQPVPLRRYGEYEGSAKISPRDMAAPTTGMPIRKPPLILRVWVAPYEDEAQDLHDQSYFYTMVHPGEWMIEANRNHLRNQFRPVAAPVGGVPKAADPDTAAQRQRTQQQAPYGTLPDSVE